jgi:hypothetical protein
MDRQGARGDERRRGRRARNITPLPRRRTMSYCLLMCASISETFSVVFFPDIVAAARTAAAAARTNELGGHRGRGDHRGTRDFHARENPSGGGECGEPSRRIHIFVHRAGGPRPSSSFSSCGPLTRRCVVVFTELSRQLPGDRVHGRQRRRCDCDRAMR